MSAYMIVMERRIDGFTPMMDGTALSRAGDQLEAIAKKAGVKTLLEFFSVPPESVQAVVGDDVDITTLKILPVAWYTAEDGLQTIRALQSKLSEVDHGFRASVEGDLNDFIHDLEAARAHGVRWHLEIDV
jgi:hypothetical protein